jgi:hypothetical protein
MAHRAGKVLLAQYLLALRKCDRPQPAAGLYGQYQGIIVFHFSFFYH